MCAKFVVAAIQWLEMAAKRDREPQLSMRTAASVMAVATAASVEMLSCNVRRHSVNCSVIDDETRRYDCASPALSLDRPVDVVITAC